MILCVFKIKESRIGRESGREIIREPRNSDKERSSRPESRKPRNRRDDDQPIMEVIVITAKLGVTRADSNIMLRNAFDALGFKKSNMKIHQPGVMGLGDHFIKPDGSIDL
ncbi:hypothetical protein PIB30_075999 [Stylosanthes scabra]|uniref:Uncharacterized protein n=1 Tax=Stylosanthes scabra TaxID=79078 RepID=A0ABU6VNU1_9FABA|nr:hypothetical protein [Stylosanthes scabra]